MERINLEALEAMLAKATPGDARLLPNGGSNLVEDATYWGVLAGRGFYDGPERGGFDLTGYIGEADAKRLVLSYNALPALIAELRELRAEVERLREDAARARWCEEKKASVFWSILALEWRVAVYDEAYNSLYTSKADRNAAIDAAMRGGK